MQVMRFACRQLRKCKPFSKIIQDFFARTFVFKGNKIKEQWDELHTSNILSIGLNLKNERSYLCLVKKEIGQQFWSDQTPYEIFYWIIRVSVRIYFRDNNTLLLSLFRMY